MFLKFFAKFTGKHLCRRLWHKCFPMNFENFLRNFSLQNNSRDCVLTHKITVKRFIKTQKREQNNDVGLTSSTVSFFVNLFILPFQYILKHSWWHILLPSSMLNWIDLWVLGYSLLFKFRCFLFETPMFNI